MGGSIRGRRRRRIVQFAGQDGKRETLSLGMVTKETWDTVRRHVRALANAVYYGSPVAQETAAWLSEIDTGLLDRLDAKGVLPVGYRALKRERATLGAFLESYISGRTDIKPSTRCNLEQVRRNLVEHFGAARELGSITPGEADQFRVDLLRKLGENTVRRNCGRARLFFRAALRGRLIQENPFADMKGCAVKAVASRFVFVTREVAAKVLAACPNAQWRLLFALSRFGGLRCPSEHLGLRWADVDWTGNRITVHSPKTEHHEGKESRQIPIFPELRPYLEDAFDPESEFVITRYRSGNANLRTQLQRIIRQAGLVPWGKPFQNLRSTRLTELLIERVPIHLVCEWIGNTEAVAMKLYAQIRQADYDAYAKGAVESAAPALQKALPQGAAPNSTEPQETTQALGVQGPVRLGAEPCDTVQTFKAPRVGLEPTTQRLTGAGPGTAEKPRKPFVSRILANPGLIRNPLRTIAITRRNQWYLGRKVVEVVETFSSL